MSGALERALADADRMRSCAKAALSAPARQLATGAGSVPYTIPRMGEHVEQLAHFKGHQYTAITAIAKRIAGQPLFVARDKPMRRAKSYKAYLDSLKPLDSHPFLDAIHTPNPLAVRWSLIYATVASLELTGKGYWWFPPNERGTRDIWCLPPSWCQPLDPFEDRILVRPYNTGVAPFEVDGQDFAKFRLPDPANPFDARSPLASQANAVNADEAIELAQARTFSNGIFPAFAVIAGNIEDMDDQDRRPLLDNDQKNIIFDALKRMFQGAGKNGSAIILDALIKDIKRISNTPAEMDFLDSGAQTKSRIFEAYGVNPLIVGHIEGANRAQAVVAEESFCNNVVNPLMELLSQVITRWVCPVFSRPSERLVAWFEAARANDPEMTIKEWQTAAQQGFVTPNEYRLRVLGLEPIDGGDVRLVPMNMIEASFAGDNDATEHAA